jgi:hypothetical protein
MVALFGPEPLPAPVAELVETVESVTDAETGRWVGERLALGRRWSSRPPVTSICSTGPVVNDLRMVHGPESVERKEDHEETQNRVKTRGHPGGGDPGDPGPGGDTSDHQRGAGMAFGQTA